MGPVDPHLLCRTRVSKKHILPGINMPTTWDHVVSAIEVLLINPGLKVYYGRTREFCSSVNASLPPYWDH